MDKTKTKASSNPKDNPHTRGEWVYKNDEWSDFMAASEKQARTHPRIIWDKKGNVTVVPPPYKTIKNKPTQELRPPTAEEKAEEKALEIERQYMVQNDKVTAHEEFDIAQKIISAKMKRLPR